MAEVHGTNMLIHQGNLMKVKHRIILGTMEIDRQALIKLLEAFVDVSEVFQRRGMLYQNLFSAACKANGLNDEEIQKVFDAGRKEVSPKIDEECRSDYLSLLAKLPQIVDLLDSNQDEAFRLLKEWTPKGLPN